MVSRIIPVAPFDLVVFGGTGDLAKRKILPALFRRFVVGQIPQEFSIIGVARTKLKNSEYKKIVKSFIKNCLRKTEDKIFIEQFVSRVKYVSLDASSDTGWSSLIKLMHGGRVRAFYFSVKPSLFSLITERLGKIDIVQTTSRIVVEKPFGYNLDSAKNLNRTLSENFLEEQVYRIDHYLGKETVQNLMALRFGNMLFEPLWNSQYIDHIQITVAEEIGVEGRGEYYEKTGAMRDMVQNHLMQLICLIAMEPPSNYMPDEVRDEKLKVIRALDPVKPHQVVRGQYKENLGVPRSSYRDHAQNPESLMETFVALKAQIKNWRWSGTPFYLRTGKKLMARSSEIAVIFKEPRHSIFDQESGGHRNTLVIKLQPDEGITMDVTIKEPGPGGMRLISVPLDMTFAQALGPAAEEIPDAYERLIMDVIRGNQTLFMRGDEVEAAWEWTDAVIEGWEKCLDAPKPYMQNSSGPQEAEALMSLDGRSWRKIK